MIEYMYFKNLYVKNQDSSLETHKSCFHYGMQTSVEFKNVCKKNQGDGMVHEKTKRLNVGGDQCGASESVFEYSVR